MKRSFEFGNRRGRALDDLGESELERRLIYKESTPPKPRIILSEEELEASRKRLDAMSLELDEIRQTLVTLRESLKK